MPSAVICGPGKILLAIFFASNILLEVCCYNVHLSYNYFDGWTSFFAVSRETLQLRLDEMNAKSGDNDVKFFLPSKPILQDIIAEDQHVVLIGYGDVTFPKLSSGEVRSPSEGRVNRTYDSLELTIPFLTTGSRNNDIDSKITLFLSRYTSSENLYFDPNVVLPERTKAEVLSQTENGTHVMLEFQHGDFKFKIRGEIAADCEEPEDHVESDVETYVEELSMSQTRPKYSICDPLQADMDDDFCRVWNKYKKEIIQSGANVCQRWSACSPIDCAASFTIVEMSNEFKKYMALDDCHLDAIEAATTSRRNQIGLKFPCF